MSMTNECTKKVQDTKLYNDTEQEQKTSSSNMFVEIFAPENQGRGNNTDESKSAKLNYVDAYVVQVEPKQCGPLVKRLSYELPLDLTMMTKNSNSTDDNTRKQDDHRDDDYHHRFAIDLSHLKRVKRSTIKASDDKTMIADLVKQSSTDQAIPESKSQSLSKKRRRSLNDESSSNNAIDTIKLEIILGEVEAVKRMFLLQTKNGNNGDSHVDEETQESTVLEALKEKYHLKSPTNAIYRWKVPKRIPESKLEWEEFRSQWPTTYFPNKTLEHRIEQLQLSTDEIKQMEYGMEQAIIDAHNINASSITGIDDAVVGAIVIRPSTGEIVGSSYEEIILQLQECQEKCEENGCTDDQTIAMNNKNPLQTSVIYAIQSVSRKERHAALQEGMNSTSFQDGQYLCTGFDVYTTREPTVYEAMALVHSRIRRLVFGCSLQTMIDESTNGGAACTGGLTQMYIHSLPGTNHKYRVFTCNKENLLYKQCCSLIQNHSKGYLPRQR